MGIVQAVKGRFSSFQITERKSLLNLSLSSSLSHPDPQSNPESVPVDTSRVDRFALSAFEGVELQS